MTELIPFNVSGCPQTFLNLWGVTEDQIPNLPEGYTDGYMIESIMRVTGHGSGIRERQTFGWCFGEADRKAKGEKSTYMAGYYCHIAQAGYDDFELDKHEVTYWMKGTTATSELDSSVTESQFGEVSRLQFEELENFVDAEEDKPEDKP
jgi:hypothetical protein